MNIKLEYEITNEAELYELYGAVVMIMELKRAQASMPYYIEMEKQIGEHLDPKLRELILRETKKLTEHPESELNYHLDKAEGVINKDINLNP